MLSITKTHNVGINHEVTCRNLTHTQLFLFNPNPNSDQAKNIIPNSNTDKNKLVLKYIDHNVFPNIGTVKNLNRQISMITAGHSGHSKQY